MWGVLSMSVAQGEGIEGCGGRGCRHLEEPHHSWPLLSQAEALSGVMRLTAHNGCLHPTTGPLSP